MKSSYAFAHIINKITFARTHQIINFFLIHVVH